MRVFDDPAAILESTSILERFLRYVAVDTQSDEDAEGCPSTEKQWNLARMLVTELRELGLEDANVDDRGYVVAHRPGNRAGKLGWIAHLDTAPAFSGENVQPQLHENYGGEVLELGHGIQLDPADDPHLAECEGDTIITASGDTLLGADDKAGIAAIMTAWRFWGRTGICRPPTWRSASIPTRRSAAAPTTSRWKTSERPSPSPSTGASPAR